MQGFRHRHSCIETTLAAIYSRGILFVGEHVADMIGLEHTDVAGRHRADQSVVLCQERVVFRIQIRSKVGRKSLDFDVIRIVSILTERDLAEVLALVASFSSNASTA